MKKLSLVLYFSLTLLFKLSAQNTLPNTDIFLLDMHQQNGQYTFGQPVNITKREGYDNQPYFTPDGRYIYYSSIRESKNADIYRYDIGTEKTDQFTNTPEDEYSPQLTPDGKYISVVRVEKDSEQRIWLLPLKNEKGKEKEHVIMPNMDSVGYYIWGNKILYFVDIKKPQTLYGVRLNWKNSDTTRINDRIRKIAFQYINTTSYLSKEVGRALQWNHDSNEVYYTRMSADTQANICSGYYSFYPKQIIQMPKGTQDFALGPDNTIYMGSKGKLYKYKQGTDKDWLQIADFSNTPVKDFYRLAINKKGDRIALVSFTGAKP
jgi:dipeptidyl aminopeptidase/acylaminoacyl peptidase